MFLTDALRLKPGMSVAFVGAGGKSAALTCLAREGESLHPVVLTTSTRIGREQSGLASTHIILERPTDIEKLARALGAVGGVIVTGPLTDGDTKWLGVENDLLETVWNLVRREGGILAIEADGARGKSLKVPAEHEPKIPPFTDVVVPIVGIDVLGTHLEGDKVHRPAEVGRLLGLGPSDPIEIDHIAQVLTSPDGGLRGVPASAEVRSLINKVADFEATERARLIARRTLESPRIMAVLSGNLFALDAVERVWGRVAAVVLAAGGSTRLNQPKPLLTFRGRPLVRFSVDAALEAGLSPILVIVGHEGDQVRRVLEGLPVSILENSEWSAGQSSSVRLGVGAVESSVEGVAFFLADMPFVSAGTVGRLIGRYAETLAPIVAPAAGGSRGNPVFFDRRTFTDLKALRGDTGGRAIFHRFEVLDVACEERELMDIDDPQDVERLRSLE